MIALTLQRIPICAAAMLAAFFMLIPVGNGQVVPLPEQAESTAETIAKCLRDLASADDEVRKGAVLLLGKYDAPQAEQALATALADASPKVRHAAAVALSEDRSISPAAGQAMLRRLDDDDVHVRRVITSHLPYLLQGRSGMQYRIVNGQMIADVGPPLVIPADIRGKLVAAFSDTDAVVRKNMVDNFNYLRSYVSGNALIPLLRDADRDVRSLALESLQQMIAISVLIENAMHLIKDEDPVIRLHMAELLGNSPTAESAQALEGMTGDADFLVATQALVSLHRMGRRNTIKELLARLDDPRMPERTATAVIGALASEDGAGADELLALLRHRRSAYRQAALMALMNTRTQIPQEYLSALLADDNASVRSLAVALVSRLRPVPTDLAKAVVGSPHKDVRARARQMLRSMPDDAVMPLLEDMLIDESPEVRVDAVTEQVLRNAKGWEDTLNAAIDAEDQAFLYRLMQSLSMSMTPPLNAALLKAAGSASPEKQAIIRGQLQRNSSRSSNIISIPGFGQ